MSEKQTMYSKPVVLNSIAHKELKIAPVTSYDFAKDFNSCILLGQEFFEAAKDFPIVFSTVNDVVTPVAILGIDSNLYVNSEGRWTDETYIPAFLRRYPYILAEGLTEDGSLTLCVDSDYSGFNAEEGVRLFTDNSENTPALDNAIEFLRQYNTQHEITKLFVNQIKELNVLTSVDANITLAKGQKYTFKNLSMINEQALLNLPDADMLALVKRGFMSWIYAHLFSLTNFKKTLNRVS